MKSSPLYLNLGCGMWHGKHWVNVDGSPNVILDNRPWLKKLLYPFLPASAKKNNFVGCIYLDLRKPWHFETGSADAIYSSHCFEHLSLKDGQHVLKETLRVLKPGGILRFVLPSLSHEVNTYLDNKKKNDPLAASHFSKAIEVFSEEITGPWWYRIFRTFYDKNSHKWFYDEASLSFYLKEAGFENIESKKFLQSSLPYLDEVEQWYKVSDAICIEATKPAIAVSKNKAA